jgi:hypothetical protein
MVTLMRSACQLPYPERHKSGGRVVLANVLILKNFFQGEKIEIEKQKSK